MILDSIKNKIYYWFFANCHLLIKKILSIKYQVKKLSCTFKIFRSVLLYTVFPKRKYSLFKRVHIFVLFLTATLQSAHFFMNNKLLIICKMRKIVNPAKHPLYLDSVIKNIELNLDYQYQI